MTKELVMKILLAGWVYNCLSSVLLPRMVVRIPRVLNTPFVHFVVRYWQTILTVILIVFSIGVLIT